MRLGRTDWWWVLVLAVGFLAFMVGLPLAVVSDTFFVLNGGRFIAEHGLPHHDTLTVIAHGREWIDQQWLAHLAFYGLDRIGGLVTVVVVGACAALVALTLLLLALRALGLAPVRVAALGVVALVEIYPYSSARAQALALPLFVLLLVGLDRARARRALAWWSLPVLILWANLHGSVLVGVGLVVAWVLAEIWGDRRSGRPLQWQLPVLGVAAVATLAATPYGLAGAKYYAAVTGHSGFREIISEWQPASLGAPQSWPFIALLVVTLLLLGANWRRLPTFHWLTVLPLGLAGLWSIRFSIFFSLAAVYTLGLLWARVPVPERPAPRWLAPACVVLTAGGLAALIATVAAGDSRLVRRTPLPVAALPFLDRIEQRPGARVLADDQSSNYVLWTHPGLSGRVALDGRLELLKDRELRAFARFLGAAAEWPRFAAGYDAIVLDPEVHDEIAKAIRHDRHWAVVLDRGDTFVAERRRA